tara:strand:+ start:9215 stop:10204 length:990 start_codon:yes stop_codon:yes gene_type:complete
MTNLPFIKLNRNVLTKKQSETSDKFGCDPYNRPVKELLNYGIINIDKPKGPTSHQVTAYAKDILGLKKAGHSGTLDPKVTGVLPTAIGRGTRIVQTLLIAGKEYVCLMHLHKKVDKDKIKQVMNNFLGVIDQLPPVKSAVKRRLRQRTIYYLDVLDIKDQDVLFKVGCEAGTYIRKLCHDIGLQLNTGAHMAELRRTKVATFSEDTLVTMNDIKDSFWYFNNENNEKFIRHVIKPIEVAVDHLPKVWVLDTSVNSLCHGASLKIPGISKLHDNIEVDDMVAVMTLKNELVCIGNAKITSKHMFKRNRGLAVTINKVFMLPGIYPRIENK